MTDDNKHNELSNFIDGYRAIVIDGVFERWNKIKPEIYRNEKHDVVWALISRQATLGIEFIDSPGIWTPHIAPLILRGMIDCHITLAWVLLDTKSRCELLVKHGLGSAKLWIINMRKLIDDEKSKNSIDEEMGEWYDRSLKVAQDWFDSQIADGILDINLGSMSGKSIKKMAEEAGLEVLYKSTYATYSGAIHCSWRDLHMLNTIRCDNPLHKGHRIPMIPGPQSCRFFARSSAEYVTMAFELIDKNMGISCDIQLPRDYFLKKFPH